MKSREVKKCHVCSRTYDPTLSYCLNDGEPLALVDPLIGATLDGRYRIESYLGGGGMGAVYRATHVHIDTELAVKVLHPDLVANQSAIERFRREAKAAGRIRHPNAIQVTDFGATSEGIVYLVMELVDGRSLRELIHQEKTFEPRRAINIMHQVCAAIEAAHQSGVIHRDLKPDNILVKHVGAMEKVKVLDFGIAKLREQSSFSEAGSALTREGTVIGTPEYMSPEQCRGRGLDARSDIYSLGTILYEMLCGSPPFTGDSPFEVVAKHLKDTTRPLRQIRPAIPGAIERVVMRALEKDPDNRPPSAVDFSHELREAIKQTKDNYATEIIASPPAPDPSPEDDDDAQGDFRPRSKEQVRISGDDTIIDSFMADRRTMEATPSSRETRVYSDKNIPSQAPEAENPRPESVQEVRSYATPVSSPEAVNEDGSARKPLGSPMLIIAATVILIVTGGVLVYLGLKPSSPPPDPMPPGMVFVSGGEFTMGWNGGENDERPERKVLVKPFYMDQYEVTNQEYKKFIDATKYPAPMNWINGSYAPDEAMFPVTHVTWQDAVKYAEWAGKRLPTEKEWEYVARGGSQGYLYPWGNEWNNGYSNVNRSGETRPVRVHSYENDKSPFGAYDLAGNVSEWVDDFYSQRYDDEQIRKYRVYRGGNFADKPVTSTRRNFDYPALPEDVPEQDKLGYTQKVLPRVGFRCAKDAGK
ncbi:MAG: protein kinase domain-containing protein [Blastocatellia bacterium]